MRLKMLKEYALQSGWVRKLHARLLLSRLSDKQYGLFKLFRDDCDEYYRLLATSIQDGFKAGMDELDGSAETSGTWTDTRSETKHRCEENSLLVDRRSAGTHRSDRSALKYMTLNPRLFFYASLLTNARNSSERTDPR